MRWVVVLVLLGGCDDLWNLEHVEASDAGGQIDAAFVPDEDCPAGYSLALFAGSRYRITPSTFSFWDVHDDCKDDKLGFTHLAAVQTRAELDKLIEALLPTGIGSWRVGAVQRAGAMSVDDRWMWVTGEPLDGALWDAPIEPNDGEGSEDSGEQFGHIADDRPGLLDYVGTAGMRGLCECDGRAISDDANTAIELLRP